MVEGLDRLAEIQVLREAAQRPPAEMQQMRQLTGPGQEGLAGAPSDPVEINPATELPVNFSPPANNLSQIADNLAIQKAIESPGLSKSIAVSFEMFKEGMKGGGEVVENANDKLEKEDLNVINKVIASSPSRTGNGMPTMPRPVQEEIQVSEASPMQAGLASVMPMREGGRPPLPPIISKKLRAKKAIRKISKDLSEEELYERLIAREAIGEGKLGMALVARSINNRYNLINNDIVKPGKFNSSGKTLKDIMLGSGQYEPVGTGKVLSPLSKAEKEKVREAISLANNTEKLTEELREQGKSEQQISNFLNSTGFRTLTAKDDPSQNINRTQFKRHVFNTAGNVIFNNTSPPLPRMKPMTPLEKVKKLDAQAVANQEQFIKGISNIFGGGSKKESGATGEYIVKEGDNLFTIAQATGLELSELKEANPQLRERREDYSLIYEGEKINLPSTSEDTNFLDDISAAVKRAGKAAAKLRKGGDVGQYFEGQVEGKGDGMSDEIPFQVEGGNPDFAMLSKDEYVIPADVVAMLGNGSSDAGADKLDDFLEDTREEAFGRKEQQTKIDAEKGLSSLA